MPFTSCLLFWDDTPQSRWKVSVSRDPLLKGSGTMLIDDRGSWYLSCTGVRFCLREALFFGRVVNVAYDACWNELQGFACVLIFDAGSVFVHVCAAWEWRGVGVGGLSLKNNKNKKWRSLFLLTTRCPTAYGTQFRFSIFNTYRLLELNVRSCC